MVQKIISIWAPVLALRIPPPGRSSPIIRDRTVDQPERPTILVMPPPVSARFPETVLLMRVSVPLGAL